MILLSDVDKVGLRGEGVSVARGYARNFLLPRQLAEPATAAKVAELKKRDDRRARQEAKSVDEARAIGKRIEQAELRFEVKAGPTGSLFGSVTATDIADELWKTEKIRVDRRKIGLHDPLKKIGYFSVEVELFQDVTVPVRTLVIPEGGELPPEAEYLAAQELERAEAAEAAAAAKAELALEEETAPRTRTPAQAAEEDDDTALAEGDEPAADVVDEAEVDEPAYDPADVPDAEPRD